MASVGRKLVHGLCLFRNCGKIKYPFNFKHNVVTQHNYCQFLEGVRHVSYSNRSHTCGELTTKNSGEQVKLTGWLQYKRMDQFITLRDAHGVTQITLPSLEHQAKIKDLPYESVVEVTGTVKQRPEGQQNLKMSTGEIEVEACEFRILNACQKNLPFAIHDFHQVKESLRLEYRFLDLRNSVLQKNLRLRSNLLFKMRQFLCEKHGFVDVETPTLFRKTPGGAREFVVATHLPGLYYTLPQSPQQFKQLLMVGGTDRYMQIAKCYRDESAKPDRQPEFTQLDVELSFTTQAEIQRLVEDLLVSCWPAPITAPFPRITYHTAMEDYGVDKPDTRFDMKIQDASFLLDQCNVSAISEAISKAKKGCVKSLNFKQAGKHLSRKDLDEVQKKLKDLGLVDVWHAMVRVGDGGWSGSLGEKLGRGAVDAITQHLQLESGDLMVLAAGDWADTLTVVGRCRLELANALEKKGHKVREDTMNFLWVEDFPLFLPKEDGTEGIESAHHPFTAPHPEDEHLVYSGAPEQARSQHYDLVLNGAEIGGGSVRIHDARLQRYILETVLKEDSTPLEHLLTALTYGCPPHGGIALGLDRLLAILCKADSIRDVIAFPKSGDGKDLMARAPAPVPPQDVDYYHLKPMLAEDES